MALAARPCRLGRSAHELPRLSDYTTFRTPRQPVPELLKAQAALDDVRAQGLRVIARCPFFASYIDRHPAYADLVESAT